MKTADQWLREWTGTSGCCSGKRQVFITEEDIKEVQADAALCGIDVLLKTIAEANKAKE